jgi:type III pantothenate kinase
MQVAQVSPSLAELKNGYADLARLGVDRWLAVAGARQVIASGNVVVVDAGTAVNIELLDAEHVYRGGVIMPGMELMHDSLVGRTAGIESTMGVDQYVVGVNTRQCVNAGVRNSVFGGVERAIKEICENLVGSVSIIVTGGGAQAILNGVDYPLEHVEDLVLIGLAYYAQCREGAGDKK